MTSASQLRVLQLPDDSVTLATVGFGSVPFPLESTIVTGGGDELAASIQGVDELDGLRLDATSPTEWPSATEHANTAFSIDHVVVNTPNADRTTAAFEAIDCPARRVRRFETDKGTSRQSFHWLGDVICEVVGDDAGRGDDPATWWGLAIACQDLDLAAQRLGDVVSAIRPAIQPGRRVMTVARSVGVRTPLLFMTPHEGSQR